MVLTVRVGRFSGVCWGGGGLLDAALEEADVEENGVFRVESGIRGLGNGGFYVEDDKVTPGTLGTGSANPTKESLLAFARLCSGGPVTTKVVCFPHDRGTPFDTATRHGLRFGRRFAAAW